MHEYEVEDYDITFMCFDAVVKLHEHLNDKAELGWRVVMMEPVEDTFSILGSKKYRIVWERKITQTQKENI